MVLRSLRPLRPIVVLLAALALTGCLRFEIDGRIYADGVWRAVARTRLPIRVAQDPQIGPTLRGPGPQLDDTWRKAGLAVAEIPGEVGHFRLGGNDVGAMALPWLQPRFEHDGGRWRYAHAITFAPVVIERLEASIADGLRRMDKHGHGGGDDAAAAARLFAELATIKVRWRLPGPVAQTNGTRIDDTTVEWALTARDLRTGGAFPGWATGTTSLWRRVSDPVARWLDD